MAIVRETFEKTAIDTTTAPKTLTGLSWDDGDVLIVRVGSEGSATKVDNPPTNANLTFTLRAGQSTDGAPGAIYSAVATSSETGQTISMSPSTGSAKWGWNVSIYSGCSGSFANATQTQNVPNITINPTADSLVVFHVSDWNANGDVQDMETGSGTSTKLYDEVASGAWSWWGADWIGVNTGSDAFGATAASSSGWDETAIVVEILADASLDMTPGLATQLVTTFAPIVATGAVDMTPGLLNQLVTTFAPVITTTVDMTPGLVTQLVTTFDPTVTTGVVDITPGLATNLTSTFDPVIVVGTVDITPGLTTQLVSTFAPVVALTLGTLTETRPVSDVLTAGWDSAPTASQALWEQVNEVTPSDVDYIFAEDSNP